jgi:hypothetical protein
MPTISDVITNFGNIIDLDFPVWDCNHASDILLKHPGWVQYNPRKKNNRKGLSVTSLDGGFSGVPDLDSLREYNIENNTALQEQDFRQRTSIVNYIPELNFLLDMFPDHGRCHFLKLDAGGFFPPHRDNGLKSAVPGTFRIIVPVYNFGRYHIHWLQEDKLIRFDPGIAYFVNTTQTHSLFSFVDNSICFVMNIIATDRSISTLLEHSMIK